MKKTIKLLACLIWAWCVNINGVAAQGPRSAVRGEDKREEMRRKMDEVEAKLNLTPEQSAKIAEIKKRYADETRSKMMNLPPDATREQKSAIMKQQMQAADDEILELLTTEQQNIYKAEKARIREEMMVKKQERKKSK